VGIEIDSQYLDEAVSRVRASLARARWRCQFRLADAVNSASL